MPLNEPHLFLEGEEIVFSGGWEGDSIDNSVVWIPSLRTVLATDVAFHDCNLWPIESNVERRTKWRKDIARMMEFDPRIVVPGHHDAAKLQILEEVLEDESRTYTDCVEWSIKYSEVYDEVYASAKTGLELVEGMNKYYGRRQGGGLRHPLAGAPAVPGEQPRLADAAARQARRDLPQPGRRLRRRPAEGMTSERSARCSSKARSPSSPAAAAGSARRSRGASSAEGATVCITGRRAEKLEEVAASLPAGRCLPVAGDVREPGRRRAHGRRGGSRSAAASTCS